MTGVIKNVYAEKGYAFIKGEDGKEYFMHKSALKNAKIEDVGQGQEVTFEDAEGSKGPRAEDVYV